MNTIRLLFNDDMARAIVEGRKTVTRRPVVCPGWNPAGPEYTGETMIRTNSDPRIGTQAYFRTHEAEWHGAKLPCLPGDLLIGRECWAACVNIGDQSGEQESISVEPGSHHFLAYRADDPGSIIGGWRPSIHMPDWAARIRRRFVSVTVERLQDITEADAVLEGFATRHDFLCAWDDIYLNRNAGAALNPWVWRIEFSRENVVQDGAP